MSINLPEPLGVLFRYPFFLSVGECIQKFMRAVGNGASPGNLSLLFLILTLGALVLFRGQDNALSLDKPRLIEKLSLTL